MKINSSSVCLTRHGFAAIVAIVTALILPSHNRLIAGEVPPYPYQAPPWVLTLREKLQVPCTFEFKRTPFHEALEQVSSATGVKIELDDDVTESAKRLVEFTCKNMPARDVLNQLCLQAHVKYTWMRTGVLITEDAPELTFARSEEIGNFIERVRQSNFPTKDEKAEQKEWAAKWHKAEKHTREIMEKSRRALQSTKVIQDFIDATFWDIANKLIGPSKVPFYLSKSAEEKVKSEAKKFTIKGDSRTIEKVLTEFLKSAGLKYEYHENAIKIELPNENAIMHATYVFKEEQDRAERKIFTQKLNGDLESARVCDFVDKLAELLRIKIYPDSRAWGVNVKFPAKTAGMTVRQLSTLLKQHDIELVLYCDPSFDRPQQLAPGQPRRPPPGAPEVNWSIYLLQRKK